MSLSSYIDKDENEKAFQKALAENDNEGMWKAVYVACQNICKSILAKRGYIADEDYLFDLTADSTMMVMRNITERGVKPKKLSAYCYMRCFAFCQGYKQDKLSRRLKDIISNNLDIASYIGEIYYE